MQGIFDWLTALPTAVLYFVLGVVAAAENVFPPIPADTVVAFGSFLAARGEGSVIGAFSATLLGNVLGAMGMFWAGRRYGAEHLERRLGSSTSAARLHRLYDKYGMAAIFVSRFLPGVRALVPPFAGAMGIRADKAALAMGGASAIWYGIVTWVAFRAGSNWEAVVATLETGRRWVVTIAGLLLAAGLAAWLVYRRRSASRA